MSLEALIMNPLIKTKVALNDKQSHYKFSIAILNRFILGKKNDRNSEAYGCKFMVLIQIIFQVITEILDT